MNKLREYLEVNLQSQNPVLGLLGLEITGKEKELDLLSEAQHLRTLYLVSNRLLQDYSFIHQLSHLETLNLSRNRLVDLSFITPLKYLKTLNLNHNRLTNIRCLRSLSLLENLDLSSNQIEDVSTLRALKHLKHLNLHNNPVYPPIAYIYLKMNGGKLENYLHLTELPEVQKIWRIMSSNDTQDLELAYQLALSQGWTEDQFVLYKNELYGKGV